MTLVLIRNVIAFGHVIALIFMLFWFLRLSVDYFKHKKNGLTLALLLYVGVTAHERIWSVVATSIINIWYLTTDQILNLTASNPFMLVWRLIAVWMVVIVVFYLSIKAHEEN